MPTAARHRATARRFSLVLALLGAVATASPVAAVSVDPAVEAGVGLPADWAPHPAYLQFEAASADYVAYSYTDDEFGGPVLVHRVSDGAVVAALPAGATLAGSSYVHPTWSANGLVSHLEVTAVADGASEWSVDIPSGQHVLAYGETWVATAPLAGGTVHLLTHSGDRVLAGVTTDSGGGCIAVTGDATGVLLHCGTSVWFASVLPGGVTTVTTSAGDSSQVLLTATRAFWVEAGNGNADTLHWRDRADNGTGSVQTQLNNYGDGFRSYGGGVLERVATGYNGTLETDLDPVDLGTGAVGPPLVSHVTYAESESNGVTLVVAADSQAGRVAVVSPGPVPVRTVADLPLHSSYVSDVYLSGSRVAAAHQSPAQIAVAPADGSAGWSDNLDGLAQGAAAITGAPVALAGDVVLTQPDGQGCRVTWPGGHRDLDALCTSGDVTLGRGGQVVRIWDEASRTYGLELARQPGTLLHVPGSPFYAVDGMTLWSADPATGLLSGTDLSGATAVRTVATATHCGNVGSLRVAGRWALLECPGGYSVIDTLGIVATWLLPWQPGDGVPLLGGQFVAWTQTRGSSDQPSIPYLSLVATELAPGHRSHVYGPVHDLYGVQSRVAAVDDAGGPRLVYLDSAFVVRRVDLGWLAIAPTTRSDTTPPALASLVGTARRSAGGPVTVSWGFTDPTSAIAPASGLDSYDVRYRQVVSAVAGQWQQPASWQGVHAQSVQLTTSPGQSSCVEVRAWDKAGNVSAWSSDWCSPPPDDRTSPTTVLTGPALQVVGRSARFSYAGRDDVSVRSYDVSVRTADSGKPLGRWRSPASRRASPTRSVSLSMAAGAEACFRVRARDAAGNVSPWSRARCFLRPLDDRQLKASGAVRRSRDRRALAGTVSVLGAPGAALASPTQKGRAILVFAAHGPGQGTVEVWVGGRRVGTVRLDARTSSLVGVTVRSARAFVGVVSLRSVGTRPARIDAVAVQR